MTDTTTSDAITFDVEPNRADWYYCAIIDLFGETDYIDGFTAGPRPDVSDFQEQSVCQHSWVAGMMHVSDEDVDAVAAVRKVECEKCERTPAGRDLPRYDVLEWTVKRTPHSTRPADETDAHAERPVTGW